MNKLILLLFFITSNTFATTFVQEEITDPIDEDATCLVTYLGSEGSYRYRQRSKYDQVFDPYTSIEGIWYCETSGFISLMGDFEGMSDGEVEKIKKYLKENHKKIEDIDSFLKHLETVYDLRDIDDEFKIWLKRIIAYIYQGHGEIDKANDYRKQVFIEIKSALEIGIDDEYLKLQYLYLASNYAKQLGEDDESDKFSSELKSKLKTTINIEELKGYSKYLLKLSEDTIYIEEGGVLAPKIPGALPHF